MLTPKVQKDFTRWALKQPYFKKGTPHIGIEKTESDLYLNGSLFQNLPLAAQFGIYQDYFWRVHKIWINAGPHKFRIGKEWVYILRNKDMEYIEDGLLKTSNEARKTAIQEASKFLEQTL